jgi:hypothetical protein
VQLQYDIKALIAFFCVITKTLSFSSQPSPIISINRSSGEQFHLTKLVKNPFHQHKTLIRLPSHNPQLHNITIMYSSTTFTLLLTLCLALSASTTDAFATQRPQRYSTVSLNLSPDQASDLVAASNAQYRPRDDDDYLTAPAVPVTPAPTNARAFAARVFSLPSSLIKRHPHPKSEGLPVLTTSSLDDYVMYPVIGFQYVRDSPGHCTALPTVSVASCRLPILDEPVYGWYGAASVLE